MPTPRRAGGTSLTTRSSKRTSPASGRSKPATRRSVVVLPHPEPPTSATSSPGAISRESPSTAVLAPKRLLRSRRVMRIEVFLSRRRGACAGLRRPTFCHRNPLTHFEYFSSQRFTSRSLYWGSPALTKSRSISFISVILGPLTGTSVRVMPVPRHSAYDAIADLDTAQSRKRRAFWGFLAPLTSPLASKVHGTPSEGQITSIG